MDRLLRYPKQDFVECGTPLSRIEVAGGNNKAFA